MIGLIQRVTQASVSVDGTVVGIIGQGLLALVCAERGDGIEQAAALLKKILGYRVFNDADGKMNHSLVDVAGDLLLVPQFTLAADTRSGTRPSFTPAAAPDDARRLFDYLTAQARLLHASSVCGIFGADMAVSLINDGPATFWLQVAAPKARATDAAGLDCAIRDDE